MGAAMQREELNRYLDGLLEVSRFRDYCPNGLQVEGRGEIRRIVSGVTSSFDLIQAALAARCSSRTSSTCSPIICRWTPAPNSATTPN
jgi:hypothetical protein